MILAHQVIHPIDLMDSDPENVPVSQDGSISGNVSDGQWESAGERHH